MTKKSSLILFAAALSAIAVCEAQGQGAGEKTFKGEIADTQCALNVHSLNQSHKEMMGMKPEIKTEAECARYCVKERGGRFVLQAKDKVYKLDAQALAEPWAGQKVKIVGTMDLKTSMIIVEKIEPVTVNSLPKPN